MHTVENINVEVLKVTPIIRFPAESVTYKRYFVCIVSENLFSHSCSADITGYECDHELFDVIKLLFHCNAL